MSEGFKIPYQNDYKISQFYSNLLFDSWIFALGEFFSSSFLAILLFLPLRILLPS